MRTVKVVQINIYKGRYLESLADFLIREKPDLVTLQEVSSGKVNLFSDTSINLFEYLKEKIGLFGFFSQDQKLKEDANSKFGNAVFSRWPIKSTKVLILKKFRPLTLEEFGNSKYWPYVTRTLIDAVISLNSKTVHLMSWHGAWIAPPQDTPENLRQAKLIVNYLQGLNKNQQPFLLGGDLNVTPNTKVINMINSVANNLMINSPFEYTTHPKIHKIVPRKFLVDYIFSSKHFKILSLDVPEVTISDHLPVVAELELMENSPPFW